MQEGLYDQIISEAVGTAIEGASLVRRSTVDGESLDEHLADALRMAFLERISCLASEEEKLASFNELVTTLGIPGSVVPKPEVLKALLFSPMSDQSKVDSEPVIPLSQMALLTNAKGEPSVGSELRLELLSANRVDILMAFVKQSGLNNIYPSLKILRDRGIPVRLITSAYMGATDPSAIVQLVEDLGVEVRIDYLARSNRLHAKAWLIERDTGFTTAYVGSSNMSQAAMSSGLEWNVRFSEAKAKQVVSKIRIAFDSYWNSDDFLPFKPETDLSILEEALARSRGIPEGRDSVLTISNLEVRPTFFQQQMLDEIEVERSLHGRSRNLVVAATGTGKTVLAALDYARLSVSGQSLPRLLFVAHTKEILSQALGTFRQVLREPDFGELLMEGKSPRSWRHVFASIQSLNERRLKDIDSSHFEIVIIDEFHHASAPSYRKLLAHLKPDQLLGLTATPERTDQIRVQDEFFDGRIATELRLWDALDQELLAPFQYFAIAEDTNFSNVNWSRGGYVSSELSNLVTGNQARDRLVVSELKKRAGAIKDLRLLVFCVDVNHAKHIAKVLVESGISAATILGETPSENRERSVRDFRQGAISALVAVDVLNEGFDVPAVNTVLMLRPTESPLVFLQQLGRGLRKHPGKDSTLVLDFVGSHRAEYRHDLKLTALTGRSRGDLKGDIESGFPYLPSGSNIVLDSLSKERILESIKRQVAPGYKTLSAEVSSLGEKTLSGYLEKAGREPWELYKAGTWWQLSFELFGREGDSTKLQAKLKNFLHVNDPIRFEGYRRILENRVPNWDDCTEVDQRLKNMFVWNVYSDGLPEGVNSVDHAIAIVQADRPFTQELLELLAYLEDKSRNFTSACKAVNHQAVLQNHANYTRAELLGALGWVEAPDTGLKVKAKATTHNPPSTHREGVAWLSGISTELLLVTLQKSIGYSPTVQYLDYAESQNVFHWESQSRTKPDSEAGKRYLNQNSNGVEMLLAIRDTNQDIQGGFTQTYRLAGLVDFMKSEGAAPMKIWWALRVPLDIQTWKMASAVKVA